MPQDNESVVQAESRGTPCERDLEAASEVHIPDYVMLDFGSLEGRGTSGKPPAS